MSRGWVTAYLDSGRATAIPNVPTQTRVAAHPASDDAQLPRGPTGTRIATPSGMPTHLHLVRDFGLPADLDKKGQRAHEIITAYLKEHGRTDTGGCKAFYSPAEWTAREEQYGTKSHLVIVYDGGAMRPVFNMDAAYDIDCASYRQTGKTREPYALYEGMQAKLREAGLYFEECTGYYCAVYSAEAA